MDEQEKRYDETTADEVVNDTGSYGHEGAMDDTTFAERLDSDDMTDDTTVGDSPLDSESLGSNETSPSTDESFHEQIPETDRADSTDANETMDDTSSTDKSKDETFGERLRNGLGDLRDRY